MALWRITSKQLRKKKNKTKSKSCFSLEEHYRFDHGSKINAVRFWQYPPASDAVGSAAKGIVEEAMCGESCEELEEREDDGKECAAVLEKDTQLRVFVADLSNDFTLYSIVR